MTALLAALVAFFDADATLRAYCGPAFNARVSGVFNLGSGGFVYPVLALALHGEHDPVRGAPAPERFSTYILECWYATDGTMLEAWTVRDIVKNLLHLQAASLGSADVHVEWIEMTKSNVTNLADLNKHLATLEFSVIA